MQLFALIQFVLLILSILLIVWQWYHIQFVVFSAFLLTYFISNFKKEEGTKTFRDVLGVQFVLFIAMHALKYLA